MNVETKRLEKIKKLRVVIANGSMERQLEKLLIKAGVDIQGCDARGIYQVSHPLIGTLEKRRPHDIPLYLDKYLFDIGIGGKDWFREYELHVRRMDLMHILFQWSYLLSFPRGRQGNNLVRIVLAVSEASSYSCVHDLVQANRRGATIYTEYREITRDYLSQKGYCDSSDGNVYRWGGNNRIEFSWGDTESKVRLGLADAVVEITETGNALTAHGLKIIDVIDASPIVLVANRKLLEDTYMSEAIMAFLELLKKVI